MLGRCSSREAGATYIALSARNPGQAAGRPDCCRARGPKAAVATLSIACILAHQKGQFWKNMMVQLPTERSGRSSSARQIYEALKSQIDEGAYGSGARLPSTRGGAGGPLVPPPRCPPPGGGEETGGQGGFARLSAYGREAMKFPAPPVELDR